VRVFTKAIDVFVTQINYNLNELITENKSLLYGFRGKSLRDLISLVDNDLIKIFFIVNLQCDSIYIINMNERFVVLIRICDLNVQILACRLLIIQFNWHLVSVWIVHVADLVFCFKRESAIYET
jgi:hypothetical protein